MEPGSDTDAGKEAVRRRYDESAERERSGRGIYEALTPSKVYFRRRKLDAALRLGGFPRGAQLLEIGCNVGQFTQALAERGYRVTGVDLSPTVVDVARQRAREARLDGVEFQVADAETLDGLASARFDGVVSFSTLRYVSRLDLALGAIHRVLRPAGVAVVDFPNRRCPWFYVKPLLGSERHENDHWYTRGEVRRALRQAGFRDVAVRTLLFTPTVAPARWLGAFRALDAVGERVPGLRGLAGILMARARRP
ncbi:MAG TPA: methyltransferase domain-containing protein [Terriglobales bacterium]|nr:methyltransferase domain-containing protein [Terriglobales bacterium]